MLEGIEVLLFQQKTEEQKSNGKSLGKEGYLAFARLSEAPFHWCFPPNVSSFLAAVLSALDTCS